MSTAVLTRKRRKMTAAEFLALPDDGIERMLIRGELYECGDADVSYRNRQHSRLTARISFVLERWSEQQPEPHGEVSSGEAGAVLRKNPASIVGIDVAYFGPEVAALSMDETTLYNGAPILAVEILSPSNSQEDVMDKVREYQATGVALVWLVEPEFQTITVYETGKKPDMFTLDDTISAEPHLHGFAVPVADFFR